MSHFSTLVILPLGTKEEDIDSTIENLLAPYDENMEVPEYERPCWCVEHPQPEGCLDCHGSEIEKTTYNTLSKWDWYKIGGRWDNALEGSNVQKIREFPEGTLKCYALVTPTGEWHARAKMGWFGVSSNEQEDDKWQAEYYEILSAFPSNLAVIVDCHI